MSEVCNTILLAYRNLHGVIGSIGKEAYIFTRYGYQHKEKNNGYNILQITMRLLLKPRYITTLMFYISGSVFAQNIDQIYIEWFCC